MCLAAQSREDRRQYQKYNRWFALARLLALLDFTAANAAGRVSRVISSLSRGCSVFPASSRTLGDLLSWTRRCPSPSSVRCFVRLSCVDRHAAPSLVLGVSAERTEVPGGLPGSSWKVPPRISRVAVSLDWNHASICVGFLSGNLAQLSTKSAFSCCVVGAGPGGAESSNSWCAGGTAAP